MPARWTNGQQQQPPMANDHSYADHDQCGISHAIDHGLMGARQPTGNPSKIAILPTSAGQSGNPFRTAWHVKQTTGNEWRVVTSGVTVSYVAEADQASDNSPPSGQPTITAHRAQGFVAISEELASDWGTALAEISQ